MIKLKELKQIESSLKFGKSITRNEQNFTRKLYKVAIAYCEQNPEIVLYSRESGNLGEIYESILKHIAGLRTNKSYSNEPDITIDGVDYEIKLSSNNHSIASPLHSSNTPVIFVSHKGVVVLGKYTVKRIMENPEYFPEYVSIKHNGVCLKLNAHRLGTEFEPFNNLLFR